MTLKRAARRRCVRSTARRRRRAGRQSVSQSVRAGVPRLPSLSTSTRSHGTPKPQNPQTLNPKRRCVRSTARRRRRAGRGRGGEEFGLAMAQVKHSPLSTLHPPPSTLYPAPSNFHPAISWYKLGAGASTVRRAAVGRLGLGGWDLLSSSLLLSA